MPADVSELEALAAKMKLAGVRVRREQRKVVKETTDRVTQSAKSHAPVATGALSASITGTVRGMKGKVSTDIRYAQFMEFGTYKDAPQPYMAPALEEGTGSYLADSFEAAKRAMDF
jgi:HK97 gp10 family phage protein